MFLARERCLSEYVQGHKRGARRRSTSVIQRTTDVLFGEEEDDDRKKEELQRCVRVSVRLLCDEWGWLIDRLLVALRCCFDWSGRRICLPGGGGL